MKVRRKFHFFTLFEAIVAMALLSIVLTTLLSCWKFFTSIDHSVNSHNEQSTFKMLHTLDQAFLEVPSSIHPRNTHHYAPCFYSQSGKDLYFSFNNKVQVSPHLSSMILAIIELRESGELVLIKAPSPGEKDTIDLSNCEEELLIANVADVSFEFYHNKKNQWQAHWNFDERSPPLLVRCTLSFQEKSNETLYFHFPQVEQCLVNMGGV